jgi:hypothetical protein
MNEKNYCRLIKSHPYKHIVLQVILVALQLQVQEIEES